MADGLQKHREQEREKMRSQPMTDGVGVMERALSSRASAEQHQCDRVPSQPVLFSCPAFWVKTPKLPRWSSVVHDHRESHNAKEAQFDQNPQLIGKGKSGNKDKPVK